MKKSTITLAIGLFLAIGAQAQGSASEGAPAAAAAPAVNPFTGGTLNFEELTRKLETSKLETQLLEEQLRHTGLTADIQNIGLRKQAEVAQAQTQVAREQAQQATLVRDMLQLQAAEKASAAQEAQEKQAQERARAEAAKAAAAAKKLASTPKVVGVEDATGAPSAVQPSQAVQVLSVTSVEGQRPSAILQVGGDVVSVSEGEKTPMGIASIGADGVVSLGGKHFEMNQTTVARVHSEPSAVSKSAAIAGRPAAATAGASGTPTYVPPPPVETSVPSSTRPIGAPVVVGSAR